MTDSEQHTNHVVVVGVDGSRDSLEALEWAARYARAAKAVLEPVVAWNDFPEEDAAFERGLVLGQQPVGTGSWAGVVENDNLDVRPLVNVSEPASRRAVAAQAVVDNATSFLKRSYPDLEVKARMISGPAAPVLIEASRNADLLVVGTRGHGAVATMFLGSVSHHCVQHASCPTVVVRHPAQAV